VSEQTKALGDADFDAPTGDRWFEDYRPGAIYEYGYATVDESEVLDFARRYDPQPIHADLAYAKSGPFGGLIASGWQTAGLFMRMFADHYVSRVASLASPGVDELRWPAPVRPGDRLQLRTTVLDARPSRSKPDRGIVRTRGELFNAEGDQVLHLIAVNILLRRPA
jgi:acyl dehydratase